MTTLHLPWPPSTNTYYRSPPGGKTLISREGRAYKRRVAAHVLAQGRPRLGDAALACVVEVHPPDARRRDVLNLQKALMDAMEEARVYADDSQLHAPAFILGPPARPHGSVTVHLEAIGDNTPAEALHDLLQAVFAIY